MSLATFHRHFRAATAMTLVQYPKQIRLQAARRLLLAEGVEVAAVGYESPFQFSRDYRRLFGEPPGRDAAVMRSGIMVGGEGWADGFASIAVVRPGKNLLRRADATGKAYKLAERDSVLKFQ